VTTPQALQKYYGSGARKTAAWNLPTGNAIEANPGAGDGMVYVGSTDDNVYAVNIANGRQAWKKQAGTVTAGPEVVGGIVCLSNREGHFTALHAANGAPAWEVNTNMPATYKRTWAVSGESVILARELAALQAYDATTGAKGVRFSTKEPYVMALSAVNGVLYALDAAGNLYAFSAATGTKVWQQQLLSSDSQPGTDLTVHGDSVYLGTISGTLYSVATATGKVRWTYPVGTGMDSNLAVLGGMVYLKDNNGNLQAVSTASGKQVWSRGVVATGFAGVATAGGRVYFSTLLAIQALDAKSGDPVWAFSPSGTMSGSAEFLSTPVVANGMVLVGCSDNNLYAIPA
jgi:outer membrane protein assembly factor BamB